MEKVSKITLAASAMLIVVLAVSLLMLGRTEREAEPQQPPVPEQVQVFTEPDEIVISASSEYIAVGHSVQLEVSGTDAALTYRSSDTAVASADENGRVVGIAPGKASIIVSGENVVPACLEVTVIKSGLVFLSPSRQYGNPYSAGNTDEGTQMHRVAYSCEKKLLAAGLEVYICPDEYELEERGDLAGGMNALCYVAIHSNAAAGQEGTSAYYHNRQPESMALALAVFDTVAALTPTSDELGLVNGMAKDKGFGYKEIRFPGIAGVPTTLLEVEFHDKEHLAQWIIDNADPLGIAVADGILTYLERLR